MVGIPKVTQLDVKTCKRCSERKPLVMFRPCHLRKDGRGNICHKCLTKKQVASQAKIKAGKVQITLRKEKGKAFIRDKKCIAPGCMVRDFAQLDFHHVYWHSSERKHNDPERNLAKNGVMLCRKHHDQVQHDKGLDAFCHDYLKQIL